MSSGTLEISSYKFVCDFVRNKSAIELDSSKSYLVESRLAPVIKAHGLQGLDHLVEALRKPNSQVLAKDVVEAMTTHETSFFRDINPFDALRKTILPELLKKRQTERTISIWSNACSSGQEIYSISMMLKESFPELAPWKVRLLATDISTQVIKKAQEGLFNQTETNRGLPMQMLIKYFQREGLNWRIKDDVRKSVEFRLVNLIEPFPDLPKFDVVFLRNVLIYFSPETKTEILVKIRKALKPDGYLFLGGAETTINLNVPFERENAGTCSVYRPR
ncbi:MAG TPA: protein-glutamate O-methyltransferase CheR [Pirellulaceae bacterium]|nr:protein-glutamate O-methyltransferase CheR [Pirellulaceae bacterium]HMO91617.1 protein-glutamate O-methyltransferase CheR [Pirellulaceae bacterium]HMP68314.1 protein-glutamate O-methyltransferase CheR [Pirellulaceae bacterium]